MRRRNRANVPLEPRDYFVVLQNSNKNYNISIRNFAIFFQSEFFGLLICAQNKSEADMFLMAAR